MSSGNADAVVGMMDTAYFVGRQQLLSFFNDLLDLQLAKIEQTASGAIACQLTEYIFPGSIPMSRVNWEAKSDYEFVGNYKLLQAAFSKNRVQRHVDVDKLIRAKYQDNLEFCQWLKAFYDQSGAYREGYDAQAVRAKGKGGKKYNELMSKGGGGRSISSRKPVVNVGRGSRVTPTSSSPSPSPRGSTTQPKVPVRPQGPAAARGAKSPTSKAPFKASSENKARPTTTTATGPKRNNKTNKNAAASSAEADAQLLTKNAELENKIHDLESSLADIERERDFYFGKLRNVELMLQVKQDKNYEGCDLEGVVNSIFQLLYATADEDVVVDEEGQVLPISDQVNTSALSAELSEVLASEVGATDVFNSDQEDLVVGQ